MDRKPYQQGKETDHRLMEALSSSHFLFLPSFPQLPTSQSSELLIFPLHVSPETDEAFVPLRLHSLFVPIYSHFVVILCDVFYALWIPTLRVILLCTNGEPVGSLYLL